MYRTLKDHTDKETIKTGTQKHARELNILAVTSTQNMLIIRGKEII